MRIRAELAKIKPVTTKFRSRVLSGFTLTFLLIAQVDMLHAASLSLPTLPPAPSEISDDYSCLTVEFSEGEPFIFVHTFDQEANLLIRVDQRKLAGQRALVVKSTYYENINGTQKPHKVLLFDSQSNVIERVDFYYNGRGILSYSETRHGNETSLPLVNLTYYSDDLPNRSLIFDPARKNLIASTRFVYDVSGTLKQLNLKDNQAGRALQNLIFFKQGTRGDPEVHYSITRDASNTFLARHDYEYNANGTLTRVTERRGDHRGAQVNAAIFYAGNRGEELPQAELTYDPRGQVAKVRTFHFDSPLHFASRGPRLTNDLIALASQQNLKLGKPCFNRLGNRFQSASEIKIKDKDFAFDAQGLLTQILVRAGPEVLHV